MNYLMMFKENLKLYWHLWNDTKTSHAKFIKYYLNLFLEWSSYENYQENKVDVKSAQSPTVSRALGKHDFSFGGGGGGD
jgi:hypothetical protein